MRPPHSTVTAASVHHLAHQVLADALGWKPFRRSVGVAPLIDLILVMATTARTLFAVVRRRFPFSHETARQALRANLPKADVLTEQLVDGLHAVLAFSRREIGRAHV